VRIEVDAVGMVELITGGASIGQGFGRLMPTVRETPPVDVILREDYASPLNPPTRVMAVRSRTISGPAIARSVPSSSRVTQGTIAP
jgi:hypothetical protein